MPNQNDLLEQINMTQAKIDSVGFNLVHSTPLEKKDVVSLLDELSALKEVFTQYIKKDNTMLNKEQSSSNCKVWNSASEDDIARASKEYEEYNKILEQEEEDLWSVDNKEVGKGDNIDSSY